LNSLFCIAFNAMIATNGEHPQQEAEMTTLVEEAAWLSYPEAQRFSGLGRTKLWELISAGDVKAAKVGRAVRISRRSLDEYMERSTYAESKR
jgi:excisionase family DNA binding protein